MAAIFEEYERRRKLNQQGTSTTNPCNEIPLPHGGGRAGMWEDTMLADMETLLNTTTPMFNTGVSLGMSGRGVGFGARRGQAINPIYTGTRPPPLRPIGNSSTRIYGTEAIIRHGWALPSDMTLEEIVADRLARNLVPEIARQIRESGVLVPVSPTQSAPWDYFHNADTYRIQVQVTL